MRIYQEKRPSAVEHCIMEDDIGMEHCVHVSARRRYERLGFKFKYLQGAFAPEEPKKRGRPKAVEE